MLYVVSYDIPNNRRRTRLAKLLEGYGSRVQRSVFECDLTLPQFIGLRKQVGKLLLPAEDQVRIYRLCGTCVSTIELIGEGQIEETIETYIV